MPKRELNSSHHAHAVSQRVHLQLMQVLNRNPKKR